MNFHKLLGERKNISFASFRPFLSYYYRLSRHNETHNNFLIAKIAERKTINLHNHFAIWFVCPFIFKYLLVLSDIANPAFLSVLCYKKKAVDEFFVDTMETNLKFR